LNKTNITFWVRKQHIPII